MGSCLLALLLAVAPARAEPMRFAAIGDMPYTPADIPRVTTLLDEIGAKPVAFVVHVGDIKGGGSPCDDGTIRARHDQFAASRVPFVYTPGDNEWTDCWRAPIGRQPVEPLERLAFLRTVFFGAPASLGVAPMTVEAQGPMPSSASITAPVPMPTTGSAGYPENQRWVRDGVVFATLHVVGSNDGAGRTA